MKKILITIFLISGICSAQNEFRFNKKETGNLGIVTGFNNIIGLEIEYVGMMDVKFFITSKSVGGAIGVNFTSGMYEHFIYQTAVRLYKKIDVSIPIAGLEVGLRYKLNNYFFIGLSGIYDLKVEKSETTKYGNALCKIAVNF